MVSCEGAEDLWDELIGVEINSPGLHRLTRSIIPENPQQIALRSNHSCPRNVSSM